MPFSLIGFRPAAVTSGTAPRIHTYRTEDAHATVDTAGYFNPVRSLLEIGDLIYVVVVTGGGALSTAGWHVVVTKTATAVDVTNVTALTVTNTD
jgi:hypothetical protein